MTTTELPRGNVDDMVAANVRALMGFNGLHGTDIARILGLSTTAVSHRLSANRSSRFSVAEVAKLAEFFGVPVSVFFEEPAARKPDRGLWALSPRVPKVPGLRSLAHLLPPMLAA